MPEYGRRLRAAATLASIATALLAVAPSAGATTLLPPLPTVPLGGLLTPIIGVPGNINAPDLNGDGHPDVAVPDFGSDQLSVRINNGDGTFGPVHRYQVGSKPSFIARGDFNRDGHVDLAVSNALSGDVSVLLGNGDGTLRPATSYPLNGDGSFSVDAVDVTGDGIVDLVTSNSITNDLSVLPGRGDGTFTAARTFAIGGPRSVGVIPFALSTGDWDGDGDQDVVVGGALSTTVMLNDGHGNFTATSSNPVGVDIACTKVADLNGDGIPDIVATGTGTLNTQILLGNGDGTFRAGQNIYSGGIGSQCLSIADVNGDGHVDLTVVNSASLGGTGIVNVLFGDGEGHFAATPTSSYATQFAPWATEVMDFTGDGTPDIAVANSAPASFSLFRGTGHGAFATQVVYGM